MDATSSDAPPPRTRGGYVICPATATLLPLRRLAEWHHQRTGDRIHRSVPYRWAHQGLRGVHLPTIRIGGRLYTSVQAIAWWTAALSSSASASSAEMEAL